MLCVRKISAENYLHRILKINHANILKLGGKMAMHAACVFYNLSINSGWFKLATPNFQVCEHIFSWVLIFDLKWGDII